MKKQLRTFALKSCLEYSPMGDRSTVANEFHYNESLNGARAQERTLAPLQCIAPIIQDLVQSKLHDLLGKGYLVSLFGSEATEGAMRYHLQISHVSTGLSLEWHDRIDEDFLDEVFTLAAQMKWMLEKRTALERKSDGSKVRVLTWISDMIDPTLLAECRKARLSCRLALSQMRTTG